MKLADLKRQEDCILRARPERLTSPAGRLDVLGQLLPCASLAKLMRARQVANLAQVAALLYHSYASTPLYGLQEDHKPVVNWVGELA